MGYDLHITRAESWSDPGDAAIALEEWLAVANADPELTPMRENGDAFFAFGDPDDEASSWFDWFDGDVFTKNPDKRTLAKMLHLAARLGAKVQGDDGETYESPDDLDASADELFSRAGDASEPPDKGSKWRFWRR